MTDTSPAASGKSDDHTFMRLAYEEAAKGFGEGGVPVGAIMVSGGEVVGRGYNRRVQDGNPVSHGETDCMKNAGRRNDYGSVTMYTTLSPCLMCAGTIVQFGIRRVVIGESENFPGNIEFLRERGVEVALLDDAECKALMTRFIAERPDVWFEDIAGNDTPG